MKTRIWLLLVALAVIVASAGAFTLHARQASADASTVTSVTAAPPVSRPNTPSCSETVVAHNFAFSYGNPFVGSYAPPAGCAGPWAKVVLDWNGTVTAGRQFDRIGALWIGGVEILRTSTPEPSHGVANTWHVAKDVTEYSSLLASPQSLVANVPNIFNNTYNGIIEITATLTFYEANAANPAPAHPDQVLPISASKTNEGWYTLGSPTQQAKASLTLPTNLSRAYLEVYTTGHSCDEFWYTNQPDAWANAHGFCPGTAFREIQVLVDGKMAGTAYPFPEIFTGGANPFLWRPLVGINAFNIPAYVVDLTPFAGLLANGQAHSISVQVANNSFYWLTDANLLVYQNASGSPVSGAVTTNTIAPQATQADNENDTHNGAQFDNMASRIYTVSGYVKDASGAVTTTTIEQTMSFTNSQVIDLVNNRENVKGTEDVTTKTTVSGPNGTTVTTRTLSFPITLNSMFQIPEHQSGDEFTLPATVDQNWLETDNTTANGVTTSSSSLSDQLHGSAVLVRSLVTGQNLVSSGATNEHYVYSDSTGACFNHRISAADGLVNSDTMTPTC